MSPTRSRPTLTGTAGVTHCGSWVLAPDGMIQQRLVCSEPAGHRSRHASRPYPGPQGGQAYWTWADKYDQPRPERHP
jgi:hypothetical protein